MCSFNFSQEMGQCASLQAVNLTPVALLAHPHSQQIKLFGVSVRKHVQRKVLIRRDNSIRSINYWFYVTASQRERERERERERGGGE